MTALEQTNTEFYIVDFDRTLVDSDKLLEVFIEIARNYIDISDEQIAKADADVKQRGDSFDTAGYVRDQLSRRGESEKWSDLEKQFIHESRALNYLLPGAAELLEWLGQNGKNYGILTYGNPLWQRLKLTAAGYNHVQHIILEQKEKGRLISTWQDVSGKFKLPEAFGLGSADKIVLIDDKAVSFESFPKTPCIGYWVLDPENELPSQQGEVPVNVIRLHSLYDLIEKL